MSSSNTSSGGGVGFAGLLTILFIGLKLAGVSQVAAWSWWWVLSPLWISAGLVLTIFLFLLIVAVLVKS